MRAVLLAILALIAVASAQSLYRVKTFSYSGGFTGCTNCGGADAAFSCSNLDSWNGGQQKFYISDVPSTYQLTEVSVAFTGTYNCANAGGSLINVTLNGIIVDALTVTGSNQCKCNTCDGERTVVNKFYATGFPLFRMFDYNILRIDTANGNPICLSKATLNMTFAVPNRKSMFVIASSNSTGPSINSCTRTQTTACLKPGDFTVSTSNGCCWQYVKLNYVDPVGSKGRVIAVNARLYANYPNNPQRPLELRVQDQQISSVYTPSNGFCTTCLGAIDFSTPSPFMFGWPNYAPGAVNEVLVSIKSSSTSIYQFYVGQVVLELIYV